MHRLFVLSVAALAVLGRPAAGAEHWVTSWATSQQLPEPENTLAPDLLKDATLRQVVRLSIGGKVLRLRLSNAFGTGPLHLLAVHVARAEPGGAIDPGTDRALGFAGQPDVTIPSGASYLSDPIALPAPAFGDLAITIRYGDPPAQQTGHPGSRTATFVTHGDRLSDVRLADAVTVDHWYQIADVEVVAPPRAAAVVVLGDSITDGRGSTTNGNDRWTDALARRLQAKAATRHLAVLNAGLGGNRLLDDGKGPNALARIDRDILAPPGIAALIVLEGINDIGTLTHDGPVPADEHASLVRRIVAAYGQIAAAAHAHRIKAYIGTVMPFMGTEFYHPDPANEADRQAVNAWIRTQKLFDGAIDFDKLVRDPAQPDRLNPAYDVGDHLHLSPAGYRVMGEAAAALLAAPRPVHKPHARRRR